MLLNASIADRRLSFASIKCLHSLLPASYDIVIKNHNYHKCIKNCSVLLDTLTKGKLINVISNTE